MHILKAIKKLVKDKKIIQTKKNGALGRKGNCANGRFKAVKEEKTKVIKNFHDYRTELILKNTTEVIEDYTKTHKCPKCGKEFEKLMSLKRHILRCNNCREEISCPCIYPLCNMLFATKQAMEFHFETQHKTQSNFIKSTESKYLSDHASRIMASSILASSLAKGQLISE